MKKLIFASLIAISVMLFSGCDDTVTSSNENNNENSNNTEDFSFNGLWVIQSFGYIDTTFVDSNISGYQVGIKYVDLNEMILINSYDDGTEAIDSSIATYKDLSWLQFTNDEMYQMSSTSSDNIELLVTGDDIQVESKFNWNSRDSINFYSELDGDWISSRGDNFKLEFIGVDTVMFSSVMYSYLDNNSESQLTSIKPNVNRYHKEETLFTIIRQEMSDVK